MKMIETLATIGTIASVAFFNLHYPVEGAIIGGMANILWLYWSHDGDHKGIFIVNIIMLILNAGGLANAHYL